VEQRRRQVTVLFADVSGFTAMSGRLDAEDVATVMNALWTRLDAIVHAFGGRIDKHIGDALMALWGVEHGREDDPERAVRAALALQEELATVRDSQRHELTMRVGVNTGPVLLGAVASTTEFTAMGDTVNVASRLEQAAPVGDVLISHDTYRHIRGVFDVQTREPLTVKGKAEPLRTYVVLRAKPRAFRVASRGVEGVETSTIGRAAEFEAICLEYAAARARPGVRLVTVVGEAGIGKSRLLYEFRNWIELRRERVFVFSGRALLGHEQQVLGLIRDVLATRFDVALSDPPEVVRDKLRRGLAPALDAEQADIVGQWLGFALGESDASTRLATSTQFAVVARAHLFDWLASLTSNEPGVLLLEDVHWADDETLDLVTHLVDRDDMHLLVVCLTRPGLYERRAEWGSQATRVDLVALDTAASEALVREVLRHVEDLPSALVELVAARADGNPFYVEELVKMLIDDHVIVVGEPGEPWHVDIGQLEGLRVPPTLTGVLQTRLDGLPGAERRALQHAAVVGRVFWDDAVSALGAEDSAVVAEALDGARRRELVRGHSPSTFTSCAEFVFKHALLRDVTYDTVLLRDRPGLHATAAVWLERTAAARAGEFREVIANHLELAGDAAGAADHLYQAGTAAAEVGNVIAAERALHRAMELWQCAGRAPNPKIYPTLVRTLRLRGEFAEADTVFDAALRSGEVTGPLLGRLHYEYSAVASMRGEHDREADSVARARELVDPADLRSCAEVEIGTSWLEFELGHYEMAAAAAERARVLAHAAGVLTLCASAEGLRGMLASEEGQLVEAQAAAERELAYATESKDLHAIALASGHLAVVHHLRGDGGEPEHYPDAAHLYEQQVDLLRRLGARPTELYTQVNLAQMHLRLGNIALVQPMLRDVVVSAGASDTKILTTLVLMVEADRRLTIGDLEGGFAVLGRVRRMPECTASDLTELSRIISRVPVSAEERERLLVAGEHLDVDQIIGEIAAA